MSLILPVFLLLSLITKFLVRLFLFGFEVWELFNFFSNPSLLFLQLSLSADALRVGLRTYAPRLRSCGPCMAVRDDDLGFASNIHD